MAGDTSYGTTFDLQADFSAIRPTSLMGWEWGLDSETGATSRKSQDLKATVAFLADVDASAKAIANDFLAKIDIDAANGDEGVLKVGDWSLTCFAKAGECSRCTDAAVVYSVTFYAREQVWRKVTELSMMPESGTTDETTGLDYPTDFPFDYAGTSHKNASVAVKTDVAAKIGVIFLGQCTNPYIRVTSTSRTGTKTNLYGINDSAAPQEQLVIDPLGKSKVGKSVYKRGATGELTNEYSNRVRGVVGSGSYVFEEMPTGSLTVSWPQSFGIIVRVIEERGILPWT